jgi:signal transduction histidine kinase
MLRGESMLRDQQLKQLARHIDAQEAAIIERWRAFVAQDEVLSTANSLSRRQFVDHIPEVLRALSNVLAQHATESGETTVVQARSADGHGMHRWQQGYSHIEVLREWTHLQLALIDETQEFAVRSGMDASGVYGALRTIARFSSEAMSASTERYEEMQRAEASGQVRELGRALAAARLLERKQAEMLRSAAHDLRGNLGIVSNATQALAMEGVSAKQRNDVLAMVQRALSAHTRLLTELMDLARLQAGQEERSSSMLDISTALRELCELAAPAAQTRRLAFTFDGPSPFNVECDKTKLCRIVQNLLLNALQYTTHGNVVLRWGDSRDGDMKRWMVCIENSGLGTKSHSAAPLAAALETATEEVLEVEDRDDPFPDGSGPQVRGDDSSAATASSAAHGEGIGLSIVKRLCEVLDASLEMESDAERGTVVRVVLPRQYDIVMRRGDPA